MMRLGISLQSGYLIILASLIILMGAGTITVSGHRDAQSPPRPYSAWRL